MALALNLSPSRSRRRDRSRSRLLLLGAFVGLIVAFLWFIGVIGGNVRVVQPGRFYRSAQLTGTSLEEVIQRYGVRSVVNLRGASKRDFYQNERAVCRASGVAHFDLAMSAYRLPQPDEIRRLVATLDRAPRPILVHCQQGADRSGFASTVYEVLYEGLSVDRAEREQLTWRYGHFGFVGTWRIDRFFDLYRQTNHGESLREWIDHDYAAVYASEKGGGRLLPKSPERIVVRELRKRSRS